jgi:phosphoribosylformylglycinamidine cyclo-ligase
VPIRGMAHITGGGIAGNLGRVIPEGLSARVRLDSWKVPRVFGALQDSGGVSDSEMFVTFNMGIGFVLVLPPAAEERALGLLEEAGERAVRVGEVVAGTERVTLLGPA